MTSTSYTIRIPKTSTASHPKPHTNYDITVSLPLQTLTISKRYSEFLDLHNSITSQAGSSPPISPPPKTYLPSFLGGRTSSNPELIETRRRGLEEYLQSIIAESTDPRWRETPAWRAFLNLPSNISSKSSGSGSAANTPRQPGFLPSDAALSSDPALWLDTHREAKTLLQEARRYISSAGNTANSSIDQHKPPSAIHESSAEAKKLLVRASGLISTLDRVLRSGSKNSSEWDRSRLGDGELRRRRDLVAQALREKDDLESLLSMIGKKRDVEAVVDRLSSSAGKSSLTNTNINGPNKSNPLQAGAGAGVSRGRVLGKETAQTRELDNKGVLQLQTQMMQEQDEDVDVLTAAIRRQREIATQINEELAVQDDLLNLVDEDVDRVTGKIAVARKRVGKIS